MIIKNEVKTANKVKRISTKSKLFKTIIQSILDKKGENVISIDFKKINESTTDYFIICSVNNAIQIKAIAEHIEENIFINCKEKPYKIEGKEFNNWIILDFIDIVVHIMKNEIRHFYGLEELWSDAIQKKHLN